MLCDPLRFPFTKMLIVHCIFIIHLPTECTQPCAVLLRIQSYLQRECSLVGKRKHRIRKSQKEGRLASSWMGPEYRKPVCSAGEPRCGVRRCVFESLSILQPSEPQIPLLKNGYLVCWWLNLRIAPSALIDWNMPNPRGAYTLFFKDDMTFWHGRTS